MATSIANLSASLTLRSSDFDRKLKKSRARIRRFAASMKKASLRTRLLDASIKGLATTLAPLAIVAAFVKMARATEEFNQAMKSSLAIMGDVSNAMQNKMAAAAIEVASVTKFSATQAAESYFFLASAGLSTAQSLAALPTVAKFAQAGMFDMALATDLLTDAQSALGLTVADATKNLENMTLIGDVLVKANTLANASVQQFSEALTTKAGAALKFLNKSVEEGVAVLAAFADQGIKGAEAGTAMNVVLRELATKAIKFEGAFKRANVAVFDLSGDMRNLADIVGDLERSLNGMSDKQKKATLLQLGFSDKSVVFLQTLIGMSDRIREYQDGLEAAGGTMKKVASKQLTLLGQAWARMGAVFREMMPLINTFVIFPLVVLIDTINLIFLPLAALGRLWRTVFSNMAEDVAKLEAEFQDANDLQKKIDDAAFAARNVKLDPPGIRTRDGKSKSEINRGLASTLTDDLSRMNEQLRMQAQNFGMTARQAQIYQLALRGADKWQLRSLESKDKFLTRLENEAELLAQVAALKEDSIPLAQRLRSQVDELFDLRDQLGENVFQTQLQKIADQVKGKLPEIRLVSEREGKFQGIDRNRFVVGGVGNVGERKEQKVSADEFPEMVTLLGQIEEHLREPRLARVA